jgi:hypothetical protein
MSIWSTREETKCFGPSMELSRGKAVPKLFQKPSMECFHTETEETA